ncbi:MAG TPA: RHS repeat-associated core domain-containing protein [Candidatus Angelobacter sp.]|nr:RHS repeat-associated core domain-containing protein [Candidatus Angelobacter sp.]
MITYQYTTSGGALCAGNEAAICRRTDARNITTTYGYDALSRLTSKTYSDSTPAVTYSYDQTSFNGLTITNGKGRRTGMTDGSGQTAWSYDASGRVLVRQQKIGMITKSISYTYNLNGSINTITYPSGRVYSYTYNNALRPVSVIDTPHNIKFASSAHFAAAGMLTSVIHGAVTGWNAITLTNSFNNRLEPTQFLATSPVPSTLLNISFGYDQGSGKNNGNVVQIANGRDSTRSVNYTYDQLNRLSSAQTYQSTLWGNSYVYDAWGNLLQKSVTQGTAESMTLTVNNKNQVTSPAFTYDASGNNTWDTANALNFDAESRMNPASGTSYTYDGDGRRVQKSDGTVYWVDDQLQPLSVGTASGSITRDYVFFAGKRIAMVSISSGNPYYYLSDQIGSTAVVASGDGKSIQWEADFFPFGSQRAVITNLLDNHYQFTGYEYDFETAYNYAVERFEAGRWGRFLSPDILGGSVLNPQSLNRYAYVLNNPCTLIDPYGLTPQCTFTVSGGSDLSQAAKNEINRILNQASVQANFVNGSTADVTLVQNDTVHTVDPKTGAALEGRTIGTTSYLNNGLIAQEFEPTTAPPRGPYNDWSNLDLGLGRVTAHEFAHVFLGPAHNTNDPTNLMGGHTEDIIFYPSGADHFQLDKNQRAKLLSACKDLVKKRGPGRRGGGGGGGGGLLPDLRDPGGLLLLLIAGPPVEVVTHRFLPPDDSPEEED